ncbi:MAG: hypothetical protein AB1341_08175 [Bacillota bacterium]
MFMVATYADILRQAIKDSGKTLQEISDECIKKGVAVSDSYLSKLQNGKKDPPRERINDILAEVIGCDKQVLNKASAAQKMKKAYPSVKINRRELVG